MIKVGIDTLSFYTSRYFLDLAVLAKARGIDPAKYQTGLGQIAMSVPPPGEDIVTMAANAAERAIHGIDKNDIEMLLFATESGIDQSKAAGLYIHHLLDLPSRCRIVELKQACYGATAGLQLALAFLRENPTKKIMLIASDVARYGLNTTGESSQGSGAVAMILSCHPRILALDTEYGVMAESTMDFWRPNYRHEALVEGKYSSKLYLTMLEKCFREYQALSGRTFKDHAYYCYHSPVPRLVEKAHHHLMKLNSNEQLDEQNALRQIDKSLVYGRKIGNSYTASLYIGLTALLDLEEENLAGKRIGFYSYGSGCVAEFFSGVIEPHYRDRLHTNHHAQLIATRRSLTYDEYAAFYNFKYVEDGSDQEIPLYDTGRFRLTRLQNHQRIYEKLNSSASIHTVKKAKSQTKDNEQCVLKVAAPGKIILSGEHAVVYGQPALALAINRYVRATVTREPRQRVLFDLADLAHHSNLSFRALKQLKEKIKRKYHCFIRGDFSIREVLQSPFELAQFALGILAESFNLSLPHGVKIQVQSDIPIGCGMGSSAATILSVMLAITHFLQIPISKETLFQLALEAENMQHGRSSGLDLRVALLGGCLYVNGSEVETRPVPTLPMYLINTGMPISSTGQCIEKVEPFFKSNQLKDEFAQVTKAMDNALRVQSWQNMSEAILENHRLLVKIGVVPERIQQFISEVEDAKGVGKVCGAGAVAGNRAGALLVIAEDKSSLSSLCMRFGYNMIPISGELRGVHAA